MRAIKHTKGIRGIIRAAALGTMVGLISILVLCAAAALPIFEGMIPEQVIGLLGIAIGALGYYIGCRTATSAGAQPTIAASGAAAGAMTLILLLAKPVLQNEQGTGGHFVYLSAMIMTLLATIENNRSLAKKHKR